MLMKENSFILALWWKICLSSALLMKEFTSAIHYAIWNSFISNADERMFFHHSAMMKDKSFIIALWWKTNLSSDLLMIDLSFIRFVDERFFFHHSAMMKEFASITSIWLGHPENIPTSSRCCASPPPQFIPVGGGVQVILYAFHAKIQCWLCHAHARMGGCRPCAPCVHLPMPYVACGDGAREDIGGSEATQVICFLYCFCYL